MKSLLDLQDQKSLKFVIFSPIEVIKQNKYQKGHRNGVYKLIILHYEHVLSLSYVLSNIEHASV